VSSNSCNDRHAYDAFAACPPITHHRCGPHDIINKVSWRDWPKGSQKGEKHQEWPYLHRILVDTLPVPVFSRQGLANEFHSGNHQIT